MSTGWLSDRFGVTAPLVCAPMANVGGGRLAAAVSAAGGLGMIGAGGATSPDWIASQAVLAGADGRPYGIGLMAWVLDGDRSQLNAVLGLDPLPALVSVSFGTYRRYTDELQEHGVVVATQVGNLDDARIAQAAGVDVIVARGAEAGGHGRNEIGTLPLLDLVLGVTDRPVLAAGGIASARGVAAVLAAGAAGAWVGTAFLACPEADNSAAARARVLGSAGDTAYGRVFDVGLRQSWPREFGGRALRNAFFDRWEGREEELADDDEAATELRAAMASGDFDTGVIYAGQGVAAVREERSAAEVVAELGAVGPLLRSAAVRFGES